MKRFLLFWACFCIINISCCTPALCENIDLSSMTVDQLLDLKKAIDIELANKGCKTFFSLERGSKGEEVLSIQKKLTELGYYSGKLTGKFDSETQRAFKQFEKSNNLTSDGIASIDDQLVLFGSNPIAKSTPAPHTTSESVSNENNESSKKVHDTSFDYEQCLRFPEKYINSRYTLKGKVEQTLGNRGDGFQIRFSILGNSEEIIYVFINFDPGYNILEGDWLIIDLTMQNTITYTSIWKQEITIPSALATEVSLMN